MSPARRKIAILALISSCAVGATLLGAAFAGVSTGNGAGPISAFASSSVPTATDESYITELAADVGNVAPGIAPGHNGTPLPDQARDLIENAGAAHDTLGAFPTSTGEVCFEVLAAGDCGRVDGSAAFGTGITFGILSTRSGGTRLYGVAADNVAQVDVEIGGTDYPATLRNNGFYFALPDGVDSGQIQNVVATWTDGTIHKFPMGG
ncbi:MAG TPA: hypothetical protein VFA37_01930 [Gaiellaceae bacterium]|nr:hypothetical protein [Gaiellaceae bacterium]